jgi:uncharacterized protein (UPF0218 family)
MVTVGDFVSYNILNVDINPDIIVVDHRIMRKSIEPIEIDREVVNAPNPPGTITAEAQAVLYDAVQESKDLAIIIDGEEDLLVLPLMTYLPDDSIIIYGQPGEGMVIITITEERRLWAMKFMCKMLVG